MIHSMTGFGKADGQLAGKKVSIQIKSLNSKQADITVKVPLLFKSLELAIQKQLSNALERGKVEFLLSYESTEEKGNFQINPSLFKTYYQQLIAVENEVGIHSPDLTALIVKMPDVLKSTEEELDEAEGKKLEEIIAQGVEALLQFRLAEGKSLATDLSKRINNILRLLDEALQFENERTETVRKRLQAKLEEQEQKVKMDADRFEQELIYYMEKFDISEEKVRLRAHCEYFLTTMNEAPGQGKKLGFISQEIGREINTLGSKANHAEMQKVVVQMKEQLEKIKEQVLNVL